jgi:hypothetical protein
LLFCAVGLSEPTARLCICFILDISPLGFITGQFCQFLFDTFYKLMPLPFIASQGS